MHVEVSSHNINTIVVSYAPQQQENDISLSCREETFTLQFLVSGELIMRCLFHLCCTITASDYLIPVWFLQRMHLTMRAVTSHQYRRYALFNFFFKCNEYRHVGILYTYGLNMCLFFSPRITFHPFTTLAHVISCNHHCYLT